MLSSRHVPVRVAVHDQEIYEWGIPAHPGISSERPPSISKSFKSQIERVHLETTPTYKHSQTIKPPTSTTPNPFPDQQKPLPPQRRRWATSAAASAIPSRSPAGPSVARRPHPPRPRCPPPPKRPGKVGGPPRTLGGNSTPGSGSTAADDARARAAAAAEERLQKSKQGGKLKAQLNQQRGMTDAQALREASETEQRQRELDQSASALRHS
ncbi:predicted protein [Chaetomium globosum CBS 148.51]|uniref:Uncharacterized protein n=1 Tax=Chaetomium globosum (strain ATCC 6205 / CBS 148.51 / DSM 1962 / NBRC 6347 / NRRL 1970) TaxID=306901 RepID=Q2HAD9_CHAGB|nr:uncharacterized protein CHGG_02815 [Chaetomium globosum CBS 148.51]EAQ90880.1 predicted protein [Chaetomium globosum CBS 148.51]